MTVAVLPVVVKPVVVHQIVVLVNHLIAVLLAAMSVVAGTAAVDAVSQVPVDRDAAADARKPIWVF